MENSQSVQDQPSEVQAPAVTPENTRTTTIRSCIFLIELVTKRPWILVPGLLGIFVGFGTLAVYSLGYVGHVEPKAVQELEVTVQTEVTPPTMNASSKTNPIPLWVVGAIALSCASGCLIIFRLLNSSKPHRKPHKHSKSNQTHYVPQLEPRPAKNLSVFVPPQPQKPVVPPISAKKKPVVTVIPPNTKPNVNKNQDSLANMLDMRKQTPLSEFIRK